MKDFEAGIHLQLISYVKLECHVENLFVTIAAHASLLPLLQFGWSTGALYWLTAANAFLPQGQI